MKLAGQQQGYAMAVLLVAMAVMGVMMTVVMPVWRQTTKREREAELLFRGQQYIRAIRLFQQRSGPGAFPSSTELLVEQRYLRKKFKDPITGEPFLVLAGAVPNAGQTTQIQFQSGTTSNNFSLSAAGRGNAQAAVPGAMEEPRTGTVPGGIAGVISRSPDDALMRYNGRTRYNEMEFRYTPAAAPPGGGGGGGAGGDGRGGPARGGRGGDGRGDSSRGGTGVIDNRGRGGPPGRGFSLEPDGRGGGQMVPFNPSQPTRGGAPTGLPPSPVRR